MSDPTPDAQRPDNGGAGARLTPYEVAFSEATVEAELFPAIREESAARGTDARELERFGMLGAVGGVVRDLLAGAGAADTEVPGAEPGTLVQEATRLLYHGYHFWIAGRPLLLLSAGAARSLVESTPDIGGWRLRPPSTAGYVQLPRHLFWARIDQDATPEPVDGFFWTVAMESDGDVAQLELLLALGLRAGRPGFSVVDVTGRVPPGGAPGWAASRARSEGRDFANVLPGGELESLYALTTPAEALKLAELVFWHVATHPESLGAETTPAAGARPEPGGAPAGGAPGEADAATSHALPASRLRYRTIGPVGGSE